MNVEQSAEDTLQMIVRDAWQMMEDSMPPDAFEYVRGLNVALKGSISSAIMLGGSMGFAYGLAAAQGGA